MVINHRITRWIFALGVGLSLSLCSYRWISQDPERREERAVEEDVVLVSRDILRAFVADGAQIEISDALNRVREAGRVYIFPGDSGWELSGQYRRVGERDWHAYLMTLDKDTILVRLAVRDDDPLLAERAAKDPRLEITPGR